MFIKILDETQRLLQFYKRPVDVAPVLKMALRYLYTRVHFIAYNVEPLKHNISTHDK